MSYKIDDNVLLATARVHAALQLLPRIVGPRDLWMPWMHANLAAEVKKTKVTNFPHPRLLGSLQRVLARSYADGLTIDALRFDEVRADDPLIVGSEYVDVPAHVLPELKGPDFSWWKGLPPSVTLRVSPPPPSPTVPLDVDTASSKDQNQASRPRVRLTFKLPPPAHNAAGKKNAPKSKAADRPSNARNTGTTRTAADPKGKKRAVEEDTAPPPKKKKKYKSSEFVESEEENDLQARHSPTGSSLKDASVQPETSEDPEGSKVCDACKSRGSQCVWPSHTESSQSQNEKRACAACVSQKTRCNIAGVFSIRRPRGKAAASQQAVPPGKVHELTRLVTELSERIVNLERKVAADDDEKQRLVSRIANLERQISRLRVKH